MTVTSKPRGADADDRATRLEMAGGEVTAVEPAGHPQGTTVEVADLFFNTPARRKYLSSETTEFGHVNTVATQYALANPDVAVSLDHGDREVFATDGRGNLESAILSVYGREVAEAMIAVDVAAAPDGADGGLPPGPIDRIHGHVSHPETTRSARDYCSTYVNGRYVRDADLRRAVLDTYGDQLAADRYPFAVLFLDAPPETTDVNVHPRKMEVRFDDAAGARQQIRAAVESALLDAGLVRSSAPRGQSAPDETRVGSLDAGGGAAGVDDANGGGVTHRDDGGRSAGDTAPADAVDRGETGDGTTGGSEAVNGDGGTPDREPAAADTGVGASSATSADPDLRTDLDGAASGGESEADADGTAGSVGPGNPGTEPARFEATTQTGLSGGADADTGGIADDHDRLPSLRVLGQLGDTYVVGETDDGLVLVDQHAADERVNYERLREAVASGASQSLVEPVEVSLTAGEAAAFEAATDALERVGFRADRTGDRTVRVDAVPAVLDETADPDLVREVVGAFADGRDPDTPVTDAADDLLADLACYPSITGNTPLTDGSVIDLLDTLDACENPFACPHGRPVVIRIDRSEIDARFERDYPGA
jgi:DNA mismatch repair protein MutL